MLGMSPFLHLVISPFVSEIPIMDEGFKKAPPHLRFSNSPNGPLTNGSLTCFCTTFSAKSHPLRVMQKQSAALHKLIYRGICFSKLYFALVIHKGLLYLFLVHNN